ncbi:MAG: type II secretion system protein GspL [Legionellaceae bacterium]|nr:type II secretion system protein GspL [Legionellaceae bacterium]
MFFFDALHYTPDGDLPEQLWATRLDDAGEVDIALSEQTPEAISAMQEGIRTVIVLPASVASIHFLDLPKLSARKAREAIPYAIEEALAEPVQEVQVAFERDAVHPLRYHVAVLNKLRLNSWISALDALGINFDAITLDWCALKPGDVCATDTDLLVYDGEEGDALNGALSPQAVSMYMQAKQNTSFSGVVFDDSAASLHIPGLTETAGSYRLFIATHLLKQPFLNLCQGDFQRTKQGKKSRYWYVLCGSLFAVWFLSVLGMNMFMLHALKGKEKLVGEKIETIYRSFFPEATQVISPRFRVEQLLKRDVSKEESSFWMLLDKLSIVFSKHPLEVQEIRFRDQMISVSLIAESFAALESFEAALKEKAVNVKQVEASTRDNQVVSTLELQL